MLCLGPKKSLSSLRLKLTAQGMAQCTNDPRAKCDTTQLFRRPLLPSYLVVQLRTKNVNW